MFIEKLDHEWNCGTTFSIRIKIFKINRSILNKEEEEIMWNHEWNCGTTFSIKIKIFKINRSILIKEDEEIVYNVYNEIHKYIMTYSLCKLNIKSSSTFFFFKMF